ncbi:hypothetical protein SCHPADRAFT_841035, partial [Schizopora paradoxa]
IVAHVSTLRRHIESYHKAAYAAFCKETGFQSMLAKERAARKALEEAHQATLDGHLKEKPKTPTKIPYSDDNYLDAAIRWLISADLPLQTLENPCFREMIEIVARSKDGKVKHATRQKVREAIIKKYMEHLRDLRKCLNVNLLSIILWICDGC